MATVTKARAAELAERKAAAIVKLRAMFPIGSTVHTVLRHTSSSGMSRSISVISPDHDDISWLVAEATGDRIDPRHGGIKVGGCGMDMGFAIVYGLSRTIYADFRCTGNDGARWQDGCPSNDHVNARPTDGQSWAEARQATYVAGAPHSDGGYALGHRWI